MCKIEGLSVFINILQLHIPARIEGDVMKDHHYLLKKIIDFNWWFDGGGNQNFNRAIIIQDIVKLIEDCLVVFLNILFSSFLFVFNCDRFLPFRGWQLLSFFSFLHLNLIFQYITLVVHFYSLLFIFDLVRLLLENGGKLLH